MKTILLVVASFFCISPIFSQQESAQQYYQSGLKKTTSRLYNAASLDFDRAIKMDSSFLDAYIANGKANIEMNRVYQAGQFYEKAHQLDPNNTQVTEQLMLINFNARQNAKAIKLAQQCKGCKGTDRIIGISYYRMEDYGQTATYLKKAINEDANDADAAYTLGRTYIELNDLKAAIPLYERAIQLEPKQTRWIYEMALINYNANNFPNAIKYFEMAKAAGLNQSLDFLENYGFALLYAGDINNGLKTLDEVMKKKPGNTSLLNDVAYTMYETKKYDQAIQFFEKLLIINPNDAKSLYMAGMCFQKTGQDKKGQKICDKAIEMDPSLAKNRQKKEIPMGL